MLENDNPSDAIYDEAVSFINERVENTKQTLLEIGEFLLKRFFGDDINIVKSKQPGKGPSLRKLAKRDDINMSLTDLSRAVNLAAQEREIATVPTSEQLTLSHKEVLLGVKDSEAKKKYAEITVLENLSVRQLEARLRKDGVADANTEEDSRKTENLEHRHLVKTFKFLTDFPPKTLKRLDASAAQETLAKAEDAQRGLTKVIAVLREKTKVATKQAA
jgi:hypothetical protein